MNALEQQREEIVENIQSLPGEVLPELVGFIAYLRHKVDASAAEHPEEESAPTPYERIKASGLIGCIDGPPDLSVNYKEYLAEGLKEKYGHH